MGLEAHGAVSRKTRANERVKCAPDLRRVLLSDEAKRDLRGSLGRDHGLEAFARVAAPDAVNFAGRPRPDLLQHAPALFSGGKGEADVAEEGRLIERQRLPFRLYRMRHLFDFVIEAGERDFAFAVM